MGIRRRELILLVGGDIILFLVSLYVALALRYLTWPDRVLLEQHLIPFLILSVVWLIAYYIEGLYDKHTVFVQRRLVGTIIQAQVVNVLLAALFFFTVPMFGIAPKTNLLVYLAVSSFLLAVWRLYVVKVFWPRARDRALLIAEGAEAEALVREVNLNKRYPFEFVRLVDVQLIKTTPDFERRVLEVIHRENISIIVADPYEEHVQTLLPGVCNLTLLNEKLTFLNYFSVYQAIFDHIPLSSMRYAWFLDNISRSAHVGYDVLKRTLDVLGALVLGVLTIILYPVVAGVIKLNGPGPVLITQTRLGVFGKPFTIRKFRTMTHVDGGVWEGESQNQVTRVGAVLRKTSIDELPQMWNVFRGDMSLIGPRTDILDLGTRLAEAIPYYNIRYIIKPGVTGWAQTHQQYAPGKISPQSIEESRTRLAYDLYYIKNRSFLLDVSIALRTIQTLLARLGSLRPLRYTRK